MKKIITIIAFVLLGIGAQAQEEIRMYDVNSGRDVHPAGRYRNPDHEP
jgi:hypothetical protein